MDDRLEAEMIALLPRLRRFAYSLTGNQADADDLAQATCVRAIDNLDQYTLGTRLDSWMYRIAQNLHRNELRRQQVRTRHLKVVELEGEEFVADPSTEKLTLREVGHAIQRLPEDQRAILLLIAVEGYGYREAGEILDLPPGTVASRLSRARAALSNLFAEEEIDRDTA